MQFDISTQQPSDGTVRLVARGELDIATAPSLVAALDDGVIGDSAVVVLDLSGVTFMDSTGVRALLGAYDKLGERLRILASAPCQRVLAVTGLTDRLPLVDENLHP
jgi:anti-anti-sigma factor